MGTGYLLRAARKQLAPAANPFNIWTLAGDRPWLEFYREGTGYRLRFPDLADFELSRDGEAIEATPAPGVSEATIEHLYLNQVLPLSLHLQGRLAFHASAVAFGNCAVAFFGATGRGKSTLAASFARSGYPFLTEDVLVVDRRDASHFALPSHPSIRLWSDSEAELVDSATKQVLPVDYTSKARFQAGSTIAHCDRPLPLVAAYHLGEGTADKVTIEQMSASEGVMAAIGQSFQLDIEDRSALTRHFEGVTAFCASVPSFRLDYRRDYGDLAAVRQAIIAHAEGPVPTGL